MVALDGDHRDTLCFQLLQPLDSVNERQRIDSAFMKEVSGDNQKISLAVERIVDDIPECPAEIIEALAHTILFIAKMGISDMHKRSLHNVLQPVLLVWTRRERA